MPKNSTTRLIALVLLLIGMLTGVIHLFILRFQTGDIYPAYSSLRSDPLGTRALYESLENFQNIAVQRNYQMLSSLKFEPHTTFLYLGARAADNDLMPEGLSNVVERLTQTGGRLVLSFLPVIEKSADNPCLSDTDKPSDKKDGEHEPDESGQKPKSKPKHTEDHNPPSKQDAVKSQFVSIREKWGIGFNFIENLPVKDEKYLALDAVCLRPDLPAAVSWHSNLFFELLDDSWQIFYSIDGNPVIIERPMGRGTLVLCADSFFISNEAMRSERHPQLLAWLLGVPALIIFDETHFGIYKQTGITDLLRHYRFIWFFVALSFLSLLFVWKNTVYFVPPRQSDSSAGVDVVSEKDYTSGLVALLRRNFTVDTILQVCCREWEQTFKKDKHIRTDAAVHIKRILRSESPSSVEKTDPVAGYRKISSAIKRLGIYSRGSNIL